MIDKKGQLGKLITAFPFLLAIVLLLALYLVVAGFFLQSPNPFPQAQGIDDSLLLEKVVVQGEEMTILDGFVKAEQMSAETIAAGNPNDKIEEMNRYYSYFIAEIFNQLKIESKLTGKKCMILDYPRLTPPEGVPVIGASEINWRYYKFEEGKVNVVAISHDSEPFKDDVVAVKFSLKKSDSGARDTSLVLSPDMSTEQGKIVYYYGDCFEGITWPENFIGGSS